MRLKLLYLTLLIIGDCILLNKALFGNFDQKNDPWYHEIS